jgi:hypothetical protein
MNKFKLLSATALTVAVLATSNPVMAEENQGWLDSMKQSVNSWFSNETEATVSETFLDEVTLAVPPMTAEDAASIQPAAGTYEEMSEKVEMEMESYAPGSVQYEQTIATEANAFENITPAAGETVTEAVDMAVEASEMAVEANEMAAEAEATAEEANAMAEEAVEMAEEAADMAVEASEMADNAEETIVEKATDEATDTAKEMMNKAHDHMMSAE